MSKSRFLAILTISVAVAWCVPCDRKVLPSLIAAASSSSHVSMVGNSVMSHSSKCDQDVRSIPSALAHELQQPVLDLSFPGQSLTEAANLAAVSLRNPATQTVILPLSIFELVEWDTDAIRNYALFRLLNPDVPATPIAARAASSNRFSGAGRHLDAAFDFAGVHFPANEALKTGYYGIEKTAMPCPETDGANLNFVAANYHHALLEYAPLPGDLAIVVSLGRIAVHQGKGLTVAILPIDFELMSKLGLSDLAALRDRIAAVHQTLADAGLIVVDLSASLPNSAFADRWCACGHLLQGGRLEVARQIGHGVGKPVQSAAIR